MDQRFDIAKVLLIARHADHHGFAFASCPAGAADAVHIVLGVTGHVKIEHVAYGGDVQSARGHIGRHQEAKITRTEALKRPRPLALVQIAMDGSRVIAVFLQRFSDNIDVRLAITKDDRIGAFFALGVDQHAQHPAFFAGFAVFARAFEEHDSLFDRLGGGGLTRDLDPLGVGQECVGDPLNLRRHGGGEKQCLAREGREAENPLDVGDKAHVQHAVSLVHNHDLHVREDQFAPLKMVEQAARCCNQDVYAFVDQGVLLFE